MIWELAIISITQQLLHIFYIHHNLALMLAYLDIDYTLTPIKEMTWWNQNRVSLYLQRLRDDVVVELMGVPQDVLKDPTFATNVLREWAIRVSSRYGHSQTGRREYHESCRRLGVTAYTDDFINYGKHQTFIWWWSSPKDDFRLAATVQTRLRKANSPSLPAPLCEHCDH
jgi:hypothetical protein